jgi:hypothetical protein
VSSLVILNIIFSPEIDKVTEELERLATRVQPKNDVGHKKRKTKWIYCSVKVDLWTYES